MTTTTLGIAPAARRARKRGRAEERAGASTQSRSREPRVQSASGAMEAASTPLPFALLIALFTLAMYVGVSVGTLLKP